MRQRVRILLYAGFGSAWGLIAFFLAQGWESRAVQCTLLVCPVIGVLVGVIVERVNPKTQAQRAVVALVSLYASASLFGIALGVADLLTGVNAGPGWRRIPSAVITQSVVAVLWVLTLWGWALLLWPLSYANHVLVWNLMQRVRSQRGGKAG